MAKRTSTHRSPARFVARALPGAKSAPFPGFVEPCLPTLKKHVPGERWVRASNRMAHCIEPVEGSKCSGYYEVIRIEDIEPPERGAEMRSLSLDTLKRAMVISGLGLTPAQADTLLQRVQYSPSVHVLGLADELQGLRTRKICPNPLALISTPAINCQDDCSGNAKFGDCIKQCYVERNRIWALVDAYNNIVRECLGPERRYSVYPTRELPRSEVKQARQLQRSNSEAGTSATELDATAQLAQPLELLRSALSCPAPMSFRFDIVLNEVRHTTVDYYPPLSLTLVHIQEGSRTIQSSSNIVPYKSTETYSLSLADIGGVDVIDDRVTVSDGNSVSVKQLAIRCAYEKGKCFRGPGMQDIEEARIQVCDEAAGRDAQLAIGSMMNILGYEAEVKNEAFEKALAGVADRERARQLAADPDAFPAKRIPPRVTFKGYQQCGMRKDLYCDDNAYFCAEDNRCHRDMGLFDMKRQWPTP